MSEKRIELLPYSLEDEIVKAMELGGSNDYEVIGEIARRFPDVVFTRSGKTGYREFTSQDIEACYEERLEMRPIAENKPLQNAEKHG